MACGAGARDVRYAGEGAGALFAPDVRPRGPCCAGGCALEPPQHERVRGRARPRASVVGRALEPEGIRAGSPSEPGARRPREPLSPPQAQGRLPEAYDPRQDPLTALREASEPVAPPTGAGPADAEPDPPTVPGGVAADAAARSVELPPWNPPGEPSFGKFTGIDETSRRRGKGGGGDGGDGEGQGPGQGGDGTPSGDGKPADAGAPQAQGEAPCPCDTMCLPVTPTARFYSLTPGGGTAVPGFLQPPLFPAARLSPGAATIVLSPRGAFAGEPPGGLVHAGALSTPLDREAVSLSGMAGLRTVEQGSFSPVIAGPRALADPASLAAAGVLAGSRLSASSAPGATATKVPASPPGAFGVADALLGPWIDGVMLRGPGAGLRMAVAGSGKGQGGGKKDEGKEDGGDVGAGGGGGGGGGPPEPEDIRRPPMGYVAGPPRVVHPPPLRPPIHPGGAVPSGLARVPESVFSGPGGAVEPGLRTRGSLVPERGPFGGPAGGLGRRQTPERAMTSEAILRGSARPPPDPASVRRPQDAVATRSVADKSALVADGGAARPSRGGGSEDILGLGPVTGREASSLGSIERGPAGPSAPLAVKGIAAAPLSPRETPAADGVETRAGAAVLPRAPTPAWPTSAATREVEGPAAGLARALRPLVPPAAGSAGLHLQGVRATTSLGRPPLAPPGQWSADAGTDAEDAGPAARARTRTPDGVAASWTSGASPGSGTAGSANAAGRREPLAAKGPPDGLAGRGEPSTRGGGGGGGGGLAAAVGWTRQADSLGARALSALAEAKAHKAVASEASRAAKRLEGMQKTLTDNPSLSPGEKALAKDLGSRANDAESSAWHHEDVADRAQAEGNALLAAGWEAEARAREAMAAVTAGLNKASASDAWGRMREEAARQDTPGALWQQTRDRVRTDKLAAAKQELAEVGREKERLAASGDPLADARAALARVSPGDAVMKGRMDRLDAIAVSDREQDDLAVGKAVWGLGAHETKRLALLKKDEPRRAKERARLLKALSRDLHAAAKALKRAIDHLRRSTDPKARAEADRLEKLLGDVNKWAEDVDRQLRGTDAKKGGDGKDAPAPAPPTPAQREESAERREKGEDAVRRALGSSFLPAAAVVGGGRPLGGDVHVALPYGLVADRGHVALSQGYAPQSAVTPKVPPPIIGFLGTILDCPTSCKCDPPCRPGEACVRIPRMAGVMAPQGGETVTGEPARGAKGGDGTTRGGLTPAARGGGGGAGGDATFTQAAPRRPLCPDGTIECITVPTPRPPAPPGRESGEIAGPCRTRDGCRRPVLTVPSSEPSADRRPSVPPTAAPCVLSPEEEDALLLALGDIPASCAELARRARGAEMGVSPERAPGYLDLNEGVAKRYDAAKANRQTALAAFRANVATIKARAAELSDLVPMLAAALEFETLVREIWLRCPQFGLRARARIRELGERMEALENCIRNAYRDIAVARALAMEARRRWHESDTVASALEGWVLRDRAYAEMGLLETALRGAVDLAVGYSMLPLVASILGADLPTALPDSSARTAGGLLGVAGVGRMARRAFLRAGARQTSSVAGGIGGRHGTTGGFTLPGGGPKGVFARSSKVTEDLLAVARSPKFVDRARALGFSDEAISSLASRVRSMRVGETLTGGWADAEKILIGRYGLISSREQRILHELGHVLDDVARPGLFAEASRPGFGYSGFLRAERVAFGMQYGTGSKWGSALARFTAANEAHPILTKVAIATPPGAAAYYAYENSR